MASIPGIVFIIIGVVVSIVSFFFVEAIYAFTYVGLAFIGYGLIKIIYKKLTKSKEAKTHQPHHKKHRTHHPHCPFCNNIILPHNNFCSHCGAYLKNQGSNPNLNSSGQHQSPQGYQNQVRRV